MKFRTIWTLPGLSFKERISRTLDIWSMMLGDILPKRAAYWITLRQIGKATMTSQNVPATSLDNVLTNLGNVREGRPLEPFIWNEPKLRVVKDEREDDHGHYLTHAPSLLPRTPRNVGFPHGDLPYGSDV